jgi:hypothetical protein
VIGRTRRRAQSGDLCLKKLGHRFRIQERLRFLYVIMCMSACA